MRDVFWLQNMGGNLTFRVPQLNGNPSNISFNKLQMTIQDTFKEKGYAKFEPALLLLIPFMIDVDPKFFRTSRVYQILSRYWRIQYNLNVLELNIRLSSSLTSTLPNQILLNNVADCQSLHKGG